MKDFKQRHTARFLQGQTVVTPSRPVRPPIGPLIVLATLLTMVGASLAVRDSETRANAATSEADQNTSLSEPPPRDESYGAPALKSKLPPLERVSLRLEKGTPVSSTIPAFTSRFAGRFAALNEQNDFVFYSVDPALQDYVRDLVERARAPHVAAVAMEPTTGRVLAIAGKSKTIKDLAFHAGFPAASLFKVVTAAAAIEKRSINAASLIRFRGGDYTLGRHNYRASRRDNRLMSVGEAMGKSCNPVFGRIALELVGTDVLREYTRMFGFNTDLPCDVPLPPSMATIPGDSYELSRTGAGFGDVFLSPVHAATLMSAIANDGMLPRPSLVDKVIAPTGVVRYRAKPTYLRQVVHKRTAQTLLDMMRYTTTVGTSRREFMHRNKPLFPTLPIAAKTGTLSGTNPKGLNTWFIAAAPIQDPKIAIAVVAVSPPDPRSKASHLGKQILTKFFE
jgi:penicillin-binding protein A